MRAPPRERATAAEVVSPTTVAAAARPPPSLHQDASATGGAAPRRPSGSVLLADPSHPLADGPRTNALFAELLSDARQDPACLIPALRARLPRFRGLEYDGGAEGGSSARVLLRTKEGAAAVHDCIAFLEERAYLGPLSPVAPSEGLRRAAADHAADVGARGATGMDGADGSGPSDRLERYGTWQGARASLAHFGRVADGADAAEALEASLLSLLIDDGDPARAHRTVLFDPELAVAGCAVSPHRTFGAALIVELAQAFDEDEAAVAARERQLAEGRGVPGERPPAAGVTARCDSAGGRASASQAAAVSARAGAAASPPQGAPKAAGSAGKAAPPQRASPAAPAPARPRAASPDSCAGCGKRIVSGRYIEVPPVSGRGHAQRFHAECFTCARCARAIGGTYRHEAGQNVCDECYAQHAALRCAGCARPIMSTTLNALGGAWHPDCFVCKRCTAPLRGGVEFFAGPGKIPLCARCAQ